MVAVIFFVLNAILLLAVRIRAEEAALDWAKAAKATADAASAPQAGRVAATLAIDPPSL